MSTVATAYRRRDLLRKHRVVMIGKTYGNNNTTVTVNTGLKVIYSYSVSPTSVASVPVTKGIVTGGTIALTVTNPTTDCYLTVKAIGI